MTYTQGKPSRRKAYLKATRSAGYNSHTRDLLNTYPDWLRPTKPITEKVMDRQGRILEKHLYTPPQRVDDTTHKVKLYRDDRIVIHLCVNSSRGAWLEEYNLWRNEIRESQRFGNGQQAKEAYQMGNVRWR
jgi:hypothetical protein